jgi:hypothetical protein
VVVLDLLAEAMVEAIYGGKAKGFMLDAYPMNLEQVCTTMGKHVRIYHH